MSEQIAVVGVGNELMGDDGVGPQVIRELESSSAADAPGVSLADAGTTGFLALEAMSGCDRAVVVDAIEVGEEPGSVQEYRFVDGSFEDSPPEMTMHDVSFLEALQYGRETYDLPEAIHVVGVEPETMTAGVGLSGAVEAAVPAVVDLVTEILRMGETNTAQASNEENTA